MNDRTLTSKYCYVVAYLEECHTVAMVSVSGSKHRAAGWYLQIADGVQATRFFGPFDTPQAAFAAVPNTTETPEQRFHEGERQSYLKAVELSVASGLLGDGDKSDLLEMYQRLWPRAPSDIRADTLKSANQTVEQMFVQCPCGCGSLIPWGPAQKANSCVCGEPNSPGTHRTDGPCLAPIGDHHP